MIYSRPQRQYRNKSTSAISSRLYDIIGSRATLTKNFNCGIRQGTWKNTPFDEIINVPPEETIPDELRNLIVHKEKTSDLSVLFAAICNSIEQSWQTDKFHIVFHSSGWDSRIISAAVKRLVEKNGQEWIGSGLLFLANRWEAQEAYEIVINRQGWPEKYFLAYDDGKEDEHFSRCLEFRSFWLTNSPPISIPGNLWWYLPEYAQRLGKAPSDEYLQGYTGLFANESWRWLRQGGLQTWIQKYIDWYYYTTIAMHPQKIPTMEYPLVDIDVLKLIPAYSGYDGNKLREGLAHYACPEAKDIIHHTYDDRHHPISKRLQDYCQDRYHSSWYGKKHWDWICPRTSDFSVGWCRYGLASLCDELIRRGVNVR